MTATNPADDAPLSLWEIAQGVFMVAVVFVFAALGVWASGGGG